MAGRRQKKDTGAGANWMDTYGDLVTLLLTFFVLLYAFSSVDAVKWEKLVEVFTGSPPAAIMEPVDPSMPIEGLSIDDVIPSVYMTKIQEDVTEENEDVSEAKEGDILVTQSMMELTQELEGYVEENSLSGAILVEEKADIVYVTMQEGTLFDSGHAEIKKEGQKYLAEIGNIIKEHMQNDEVRMINAVGHTDTNPIHTAQFKDNLELSNERAANTIRFISQTCGIEERIFTAWGRSEWDPIADNGTEEGRAKNRRVQLRIVSTNAEIGGLFE